MQSQLTTVAALALAVLACGPALAANKCIVDGKTVYQDAPCANGGSTVNTTANGSVQQERRRMTREALREDEIRDRRGPKIDHQAITLGMATGKPVVGMTKSQLDIAMGPPVEAVTSDNEYGSADRFKYQRNGSTYYVGMRDNVVVSVRGASGSARERKRCLSSLEIRNLQTEANSPSIPASRRYELESEIRRAKDCG